eukprot:scaffold13787_cov59-Attheya_sp.AAC.3
MDKTRSCNFGFIVWRVGPAYGRKMELKRAEIQNPKSEASLVSAPSTVETSNLPKPKLKLKLGDLGTALKAADRDDKKAKSVEEKDGFEDLGFNIVVRPNSKTTMQSSLMVKRKKDSVLNPYCGSVQDNDDEEWVPGGSSSSRKRSSVPTVTKVVSSLMPVTSSLKHQNNLTTMGKTLNSMAFKRGVASSCPATTEHPLRQSLWHLRGINEGKAQSTRREISMVLHSDTNTTALIISFLARICSNNHRHNNFAPEK